MRHGVIAMIALCSIIVTGCSNNNVTTSSQDLGPSSWSSMSQDDKVQQVKSELARLKYNGYISPEHIATELDSWFSTMTDESKVTVSDAIDQELSTELVSNEMSNVNSLPDAEKLKALQDYLLSSPDSAFLTTASNGDLENTISGLQDSIKAAQDKAKQAAQKKQNCPLKIVKAYVQKDIIGTPEAYVIVTNIGKKRIDAYKVAISCFNSFGDPVNDVGTDSNVFNGISQDNTISPGQTFGYNYSWMLAMQDTTTKITAEITEVHFTDGTKWSLDDSQ